MGTISVLDKVLNSGIVSIDCPVGRFQHELVYPLSDRSRVLDLAPPLYYPSSKSKVYDRSPYGNHGTITGAIWKRLPSSLWYLDLDGTDDNIDCGNNNVLNFTTGAFAIDFWVNPDGFGVNSRVIQRGANFDDGWLIYFHTTQYMVLRLAQTAAHQDVVSEAVLTASEWQHIEARRTGTSGLILRNGVDVTASCAILIDPETSTKPLQIGQSAAGNSFYDGKIALTRVYNSVKDRNHYNRERHLFGV